MKNLALVLIGLVISFEASATGGFSCSYALDGIKFELGGVTSRSFENAIVDAAGTVTGEMGDDGSVMKVDYAYNRDNVSQYWNSGNEFRIVLYAEKESPSALLSSLKTVIQTTSVDGIDFTGTISFEYRGLDGSWSIEEAPITCGVE